MTVVARRTWSGRVGPWPDPAAPTSADNHVDGDRGRVGERVVHGRTPAGLLHEATQGLVVGVALDLEGDANRLIAVADGVAGEAEDAEQVDVTLHLGAHAVQLDVTDGGDVVDARG